MKTMKLLFTLLFVAGFAAVGFGQINGSSHDFEAEAWTDEKNTIVIVFEVESRILQKSRVKQGPFVTDEKNSKAFLEKHKKLIAGPRIENGKWVIEVTRKYNRIENMLRDFMKKEKKVEKALLKKAINKNCRILEEENLVGVFKQNKEFAEFLTTHLKGEEEFLG